MGKKICIDSDVLIQILETAFRAVFERSALVSARIRPGVAKATPPPLLSIPLELRDKIYGLCISLEPRIVEPTYKHGTTFLWRNGMLDAPTFTGLVRPFRLIQRPTGLLFVSKQISAEIKELAYSTISFEFPGEQAEALRQHFAPKLGLDLRFLKKLHMNLPDTLKVKSIFMPEYLDLFGKRMPNLSEVYITTWHLTTGKTSRWDQEHRAILHTVAWITVQHPQLDSAFYTQWRDYKKTKEGRLVLDEAGKTHLSFKIVEADKSLVRGQKLHARVLEIDCGLVCQTGWDKLTSKTVRNLEYHDFSAYAVKEPAKRNSTKTIISEYIRNGWPASA